MLVRQIPFFTDNCVPDSVGGAVVAAGHGLVRLRDCMPTDSKDPSVALVSAASGFVLVSFDRDFKQVAKRLQVTQRQYADRLHRIDMRCQEPDGAARIAAAMSIIEHEWSLLRDGAPRPMIIEVRPQSILVRR